MAFVSNDYIESMNRNVLDLVGIIINRLVAEIENCISTKEVNGHALNGRDINECITLFRACEIALWQHLWIKFVFFAEVFSLKALTVNFVNLVDLQSRFGLE